jgi:hypothetical protein
MNRTSYVVTTRAPRLTAEQTRIAEYVRNAGAVNAYEMTRAEHESVAWLDAFAATVRSIGDSLQTRRACQDYGTAKPIDADRAARIVAFVLAPYRAALAATGAK